jgi:hypothetical protein
MKNLMTIREIAEYLDLKTDAVKFQIYRRKIKRVKLKNRNAYYSRDVLSIFEQHRNTKYYPLKTTIIYHVYESKMNYESK